MIYSQLTARVKGTVRWSVALHLFAPKKKTCVSVFGKCPLNFLPCDSNAMIQDVNEQLNYSKETQELFFVSFFTFWRLLCLLYLYASSCKHKAKLGNKGNNGYLFIHQISRRFLPEALKFPSLCDLLLFSLSPSAFCPKSRPNYDRSWSPNHPSASNLTLIVRSSRKQICIGVKSLKQCCCFSLYSQCSGLVMSWG